MYKYKYKTTQEFIREAKKTHDEKYDYSDSNYKNAKTKIKILCKKHGVFEQIPRQHIAGGQCQKCVGTYMDGEYFKEKAIAIHHSNYSYCYVNYTNNKTPVTIVCPTV